MARENESQAFLELPDVAEQIGRARQWASEQVGVFVLEATANAAECERFESPLEVIFAAWFEAVQIASYPSCGLELQTQKVVKVAGQTYRLDFVVTPADTDAWYQADLFGLKWAGIAVEVDGHDFHERTKEQVASRNKRDRLLTKAGWTVFHFSGSELHRNPAACAEEVFDHSLGCWEKFRFQLHNKVVACAHRTK